MTASSPGTQPAGFWRRALAWSVDWLSLSPLLLVLSWTSLHQAWDIVGTLHGLLNQWVFDHVLLPTGALATPQALLQALQADRALQSAVEAHSVRLGSALTLALAGMVGSAAVYFIAFEASAWQATPGKRLLGLLVADMQLQRIGMLRAALRFFSGGLSWLSLNLGHALAGWRRDGRALHDLLAGTQVLAKQPLSPVP